MVEKIGIIHLKELNGGKTGGTKVKVPKSTRKVGTLLK
jgi:hypothetical protein